METVKSDDLIKKDLGTTLVIFLKNGNSLLLPFVKNFSNENGKLSFYFYDEKFKKYRLTEINLNNVIGYGLSEED